MTKFFKILGAALFSATLLASTDAFAAGQTLGQVIDNTFLSFSDTPGLITGFAYLCGLVLGFMGIMKLKDHVEAPNQVPIWDPIKRFLAGGSFFVLPYVYNAVRNTIDDGTGTTLAGSDFNTSGVSAGGLNGAWD